MHFGWRISEVRIGRTIALVAAGTLVTGVLDLACQSAFGANPSGEMTKATWRQAIAQPHTKDLARGCLPDFLPLAAMAGHHVQDRTGGAVRTCSRLDTEDSDRW